MYFYEKTINRLMDTNVIPTNRKTLFLRTLEQILVAMDAMPIDKLALFRDDIFPMIKDLLESYEIDLLEESNEFLTSDFIKARLIFQKTEEDFLVKDLRCKRL